MDIQEKVKQYLSEGKTQAEALNLAYNLHNKEVPKMQKGGTWQRQLEDVRLENLNKPRKYKTVAELLAEKKIRDQNIGREERPLTQRDNTRVNINNKSELISKTARNKTDKEIGDERKAKIQESDNARNTPLTSDNWRQQLALQTQSTGDKFRISDEPNFFDDYLNPAVMVGGMASNLGQAPLQAQQQDSYIPYLTSIGAPLAVGAMAGIGVSSNSQFVNNLVNPLAGTGDLTSGFSKKIKDLDMESFFKNRVMTTPEEIEKLSKFQKRDLLDMIETEEGRRRLINMGVDPEKIKTADFPVFNVGNKSQYDGIANTIQVSNRGSGVIPAISHENAHWLQQIYENQKKVNLKRADVFADDSGLSFIDKLKKGQRERVEISKTPLDKELLDLYPEEGVQKGVWSKEYMKPREYFNYNIASIPGTQKEPMAFARELRQKMLDSGHLKNKYDIISEEEVLSFMKSNETSAGKTSDAMDRITSISTEKEVPILTKILNNLPSIAPIGLGASYLATQKDPKFQKGGTVDMYGNEITAPIQFKNIPRSYYDNRRGVINVGEDYKNLSSGEQKELIAHENRHDWQYRNDRSNFNITHNPDYAFNDRLQKKPGITTTDEVYNSYHNRQQKETDTTLNNFKQNFPQFSFIPNQLLYDKGFADEMYDDKFSLEGEAQHYQKTGQKSFKDGGTINYTQDELNFLNSLSLK